MHNLIRKDGDFEIYQIRVDDKYLNRGMPENSRGASDDGAIVIRGLFHNHQGGYVGVCAEEYREFTASGDCWQAIGLDATFSRDSAIRLMNQLAKDNPTHKFSVECVKISQHRSTIASIHFEQ